MAGAETPLSLLKRVVHVLTRLKYPEGTDLILKDFYNKHSDAKTSKSRPPNFRTKNKTTWYHCIALGNPGKVFANAGAKTGAETIERLRELLPKIKLMQTTSLAEPDTIPLLKKVLTHLEVMRDDQRFVGGERSARSHPTQLGDAPKVSAREMRAQNLIFIGDAESAVRKFRRIHKGARIVYNTVFTRSRQTLSYVFSDTTSKFQRLQLDLIRKEKCIWIEFVRDDPGELEHADKIRRQLKSKAQQSRYSIMKVAKTVPLLQFLVIKKRGNSGGAVFFGWLHEGTDVSMVWFSINRVVVKWYYDYCLKLEADIKDKKARRIRPRNPNS